MGLLYLFKICTCRFWEGKSFLGLNWHLFQEPHQWGDLRPSHVLLSERSPRHCLRLRLFIQGTMFTKYLQVSSWHAVFNNKSGFKIYHHIFPLDLQLPIFQISVQKKNGMNPFLCTNPPPFFVRCFDFRLCVTQEYKYSSPHIVDCYYPWWMGRLSMSYWYQDSSQFH